MIIVLSIVGLLVILPSVFASVSTVSTSMSTSRATTGTSITSTVTVTATGTESGSVQLTCTPSGITISDPSSGQYQGVSLSTSPTSKTFTLTAGTANTYTCSGQSGGVSGDATIVFVDPSALTVTGTPSSKSTTSNSAFALSINLQNSQSDAITTSYSLGCSSHTCSGDSTSATITVAAGTTTALAWTVTTGTSSGTITFSLGDNSNAFSTSVTCTNCTTTTPTTTTTTPTSVTSSTIQDVKVTTAKGNAVITIPSIAAGKSKVVKINKTEDLAFRQIEVFVKNTVNTVQITVTKLADKPATVTQEITGKVYHYIQVDKNVSDTSVNQTAIRFEVEKSWISTNDINKSTIKLYRHENNTWNKLQTSELSEDSTTITYEAISPGLSVFAIGAEAAGVTTEQPITTEQKPIEKEEGVSKITKGKSWIILLVVIIGGIASAVFYLMKKNVIKLGKVPLRKSNWDELRKKYSRKS